MARSKSSSEIRNYRVQMLAVEERELVVYIYYLKPSWSYQ